jgi:biopolymer transport protein ExbD
MAFRGSVKTKGHVTEATVGARFVFCGVVKRRCAYARLGLKVYAGAMQVRRKRREFNISMNAMSDVAFLLLIFIMLVSLINYRKEVKIEYPEAETAKKVSAEKNLEIWINRAGETFLDGDRCGLQAIENAVGDLYRNSPLTRVHIIADRETRFEHINSVLQILQIIQYRVVSFVVKEAGDG